MRHLLRTLTLAGTSLAVLAISGCSNSPRQLDVDVDKICKEYCREMSPKESKYTMMMNQVVVNGQTKTVPSRHVYVESGTGNLVTPYDAAYGNLIQGPNDLENLDKTEGLDPACFAESAYKPIDIKDIKLSAKNTTITLVNFNEAGRLESRELSPGTDTYDAVSKVFDGSYSPPTGAPMRSTQHEYIQDILSAIPDSAMTNLYSTAADLRERNLIVNNVPNHKTPFYSDLTNSSFKDNEGHVYFYVLMDDLLKFSRDYLALVTYAPQSGVQELYTPFVQHPVWPVNPSMDELDVLTFQFFRDPNLKGPEKKDCKYVYDMHVVSYGQDDSGDSTVLPFNDEHKTPLFIDPEVKSRGVIIYG